MIDAMGIAASDINFACVPLSHAYAIGNIVMPLLLQGTGVALRQSFNPAQVMADVESAGATVFPGVPFMFDRLRTLNPDCLPARAAPADYGWRAIDPGTVAWFRQSLGRKIHSLFGSSETGGITYDDADEVSDPLTVGRPSRKRLSRSGSRTRPAPVASSSGDGRGLVVHGRPHSQPERPSRR